MKLLMSALLLTTLSAFAADVTGKYAGSAEFFNPNGESNKGDVFMDLKQEGEKLSGVAGPNEGETFPISNGKVEGDTVSFDVAPHNKMVMKVVLKHDNGKLKGEATAERDGQKMRATFELAKK